MDVDGADVSPARDELSCVLPGSTLLEPAYLEGTPLLD